MGVGMEMGKIIDTVFGSICIFLLFLIFNLGFPIMTVQTGMLAYQNFFLLHDTPVALMYLALAIYAGIISIMTLYGGCVPYWLCSEVAKTMEGRDEFKLWKWLERRLGILTKGSDNVDLSKVMVGVFTAIAVAEMVILMTVENTVVKLAIILLAVLGSFFCGMVAEYFTKEGE